MDEEDEEKHSGEKKDTEKANWGKILLSVDESADRKGKTKESSH